MVRPPCGSCAAAGDGPDGGTPGAAGGGTTEPGAPGGIDAVTAAGRRSGAPASAALQPVRTPKAVTAAALDTSEARISTSMSAFGSPYARHRARSVTHAHGAAGSV